MTGSLGHTEGDAEEEVLPFCVGEWQDCRELCLETHQQPFEAPLQSGVLGGFTGGCSRPLIEKKQHLRPSNNWREAPVCSQFPWGNLTPSVLCWGKSLAGGSTSHVGGFWNAFVAASRQMIKEVTAEVVCWAFALLARKS